MPSIKPRESKNSYISRCVPYVIDKEGLKQDAAIAKCEGIWEEARAEAHGSIQVGNDEILIDFPDLAAKNDKISTFRAQVDSLLADLPDDSDTDQDIWDEIDVINQKLEIIKRVLQYLLSDEEDEDSGEAMAAIEPFLNFAGLEIEKKNIFASETGKLDRVEYKLIAKPISYKERKNLDESKFLFPKDRSFPQTSPKSITDSLHRYGTSRYSKTMTYSEFVHKLYNYTKKHHPDWLSHFPEETLKKVGIKKD